MGVVHIEKLAEIYPFEAVEVAKVGEIEVDQRLFKPPVPQKTTG